jgi:hypothetical protein
LYTASSFALDIGDKSRGSTRTREVSKASNVLMLPLAFISWPVVEITADRASVTSATRIVGSGPIVAARLGDVTMGVEAEGAGHAG